jgi:hypothetical protein
MFDDNQAADDRLRAWSAWMDVRFGWSKAGAREAKHRLLHLRQMLRFSEQCRPGQSPSDRMLKILDHVYLLVRIPDRPIASSAEMLVAIETAERKAEKILRRSGPSGLWPPVTEATA